MRSLFDFVYRRRKIYLTALFILFAAAFFLSSKIKFKEDISVMLPSGLGREIKLFQNSPLSKKIFIVVESSDPAKTLQAASEISEELENSGQPLKAVRADKDFILSYYRCVANLWNNDFASAVAPLLRPAEIDAKMRDNAQKLYSPEGLFFKDFIISDPLGMLPVFADALKALNVSGNLEAKDGFISSKDGKNILLVFDCESNSLDSAQAARINKFFESIKPDIRSGVNVFMTGSARYTAENGDIIAKDIKRIFAVSAFLMTILFLIFLWSRKALLIYFIPALVVAVAALFVSYIYGGISGITIGFGSVLMGLAVDYSIYMYFALRASKESGRFDTVKKMFKPIFTSAATSIMTFALLAFSSIELFNQIAVFCAVGLSCAFFIAFAAVPFVFDCKCGETADADIKENFDIKTGLTPAGAAIVVFVILAAALISVAHIRFNASLDALNTVSKQFEKDRKSFEELTGNSYGSNAFLFVFGDTKEEALKNNEKISALNKDILKLAPLFPSSETKEKNISAWRSFWDEKKIARVKKEISVSARKYNINPKAFDGFYEFLRHGTSGEDGEFALEDLYNPIIKSGGGYAFANIVPNGARVEAADKYKTLFFSSRKFNGELTGIIVKRILIIMAVLVTAIIVILSLWMKSIRLALLSLLPPVCGLCVFLIALAVFGIELNMFGLFAMPLLVGLGIDYGFFIIFQHKGEAKLHPTKAVMAAALSTVIGFGSLMAAQHRVLFIIGFMVFTGILTALAASVFILPAFLKNIKYEREE